MKEALTGRQKIILTIALAVFSSLVIGVSYYYLRTKRIMQRNHLPLGFYGSYQQISEKPVDQSKQTHQTQWIKESLEEQTSKKTRDIWFSIFKFIDLGSWYHLSQTNRFLSQLSKNPIAYAFLLNTKQIPRAKVMEFVKLANTSVLDTLDCSDLTFNNSQELEQIFTTFLKLEDVDLNLSSQCQGLVTEELLKKLPSGLKHFKLKNANPRIDKITNAAIENLPQGLLSLDLFITGGNITNAGLEKLPPGLTSLKLGCFQAQLTDVGFEKLPSSLQSLNVYGLTFTGIKIKFPQNLTSLDLSFCDVTDDGIKELHLPNLISIKLSHCANITDASLGFPESLTSLDLAGCHNITDAGVKKLPRNLKFLDVSYCRGITDAGIAYLPPTLTSLDLWSNYLITEEGIAMLPRSLASFKWSTNQKMIIKTIIQSLPRGLTSLHLGTNLEQLESSRIGMRLKSLVQGLKNFIETDNNILDQLPTGLTSLKLRLGKAIITDANIKKLPPKLKTLALQHCEQITSAGIKQLPRELTELQLFEFNAQDRDLEYLPTDLTSLNLPNSHITDEGIEKLPPKLKVLVLGNCEKITNQGIKKLHPGLKELVLKNCSQLTNEGIEYLPAGLRVLSLKKADQITSEGMEKLPLGLTTLFLMKCSNLSKDKDALKTKLQLKGIQVYVV